MKNKFDLIDMSTLVKGDIYTNNMKLKGREAFDVLETPTAEAKTIKVCSRSSFDSKPRSVKIIDKVIYLRHQDKSDLNN